jgi:hypothetical protein
MFVCKISPTQTAIGNRTVTLCVHKCIYGVSTGDLQDDVMSRLTDGLDPGVSKWSEAWYSALKFYKIQLLLLLYFVLFN